MLIEFKIQLDGNGGATVIPASANAINPALPREAVLGSAFGASGAAAAKGGEPPAPPEGDPGTGKPTGGSPSSGSGTVFVIGPIVIFGSGTGGAPGGAPPGADPGTGKPDAKPK
jgi:hypothetical protein